MKLLFAALPLALMSSAAIAAPIQMTALPTNAGAGFQHNNFHDASLGAGTDGAKLGWFDLGDGFSFYDNVTGEIVMNIDIYTDETLTTAIGTAVGTGNLNPAAWNGFDGGLIGFISWDFDANAKASNLFDSTMNFYDVNYGVSSALDINYRPNSAGNNFMTLWGADGDLDPITGMYGDTGLHPTMGVDFVATFGTSSTSVPVPAAVWLFGSGLLAIAGISRRKTRY